MAGVRASPRSACRAQSSSFWSEHIHSSCECTHCDLGKDIGCAACGRAAALCGIARDVQIVQHMRRASKVWNHLSHRSSFVYGFSFLVFVLPLTGLWCLVSRVLSFTFGLWYPDSLFSGHSTLSFPLLLLVSGFPPESLVSCSSFILSLVSGFSLFSLSFVSRFRCPGSRLASAVSCLSCLSSLLS